MCAIQTLQATTQQILRIVICKRNKWIPIFNANYFCCFRSTHSERSAMAASWTTDTANLTCGTNISNYVVLMNNSANCPVYFNRALIFFPSALLCIIGAVGNGLLLLVLCRFLKPWNVANVFIANLALADLLFITSVLKYLLIIWVKDVQWFNSMQHFRSMYEQNVIYIYHSNE